MRIVFLVTLSSYLPAKPLHLTTAQAVVMLEYIAKAIEQNTIFIALHPHATWHDLPHKEVRHLYSIIPSDNPHLTRAIDTYTYLQSMKLLALEHQVDIIDLIEIHEVIQRWSGTTPTLFMMLLTPNSNDSTEILPWSDTTPKNRISYAIAYLQWLHALDDHDRTKEIERSFHAYYHNDLAILIENIPYLEQERQRIRDVASYQQKLLALQAWMSQSSIANDTQQEELLRDIFGPEILQRWQIHYPLLLDANHALGQMTISIAVQLTNETHIDRLERYQAIFTHHAYDLAYEIFSREKKYGSMLHKIAKTVEKQDVTISQ
ncbi:hypothetical protein PVA44_06670 (plasmid) [Entomospira nematocerorum]|uniref:Uncharacterized protein n=1 Tax=Entomospira nematocerorum TaxID=2719987 RepID=A0A968GDQ0_9SPIO|nr:hypothetical protein [Entomospira nematocera]NIZ47588.1 hypothetical protein [Entomospira nematocera]WDI34592.1 hypothetical protein PVA44_06670 [Entomospira nematocera]